MPTNSVAMAAASISDNPEFLGYYVHTTLITSSTKCSTLVINELSSLSSGPTWKAMRRSRSKQGLFLMHCTAASY